MWERDVSTRDNPAFYRIAEGASIRYFPDFDGEQRFSFHGC